MLLATSALAQFEGYDFEHQGYFEHGFKEPIVHHHHHQNLEEHHHGGEDFDLDYHAHPKYAFDYSVKDPHTGDDKEHWETRDGDKVKGQYTLTETDGTKRVVEYEADDKNGFNAVVHKIGTPKEHHEEIKKPLFEANHHYEPLRFHNEHGSHHGFDGGFVPIVGGYEH
ncbi:unnamed protein product [Plutella xylostella]|uniref:(diamondback moth) hypothetical protein n=1 Tax=Plutella xylostella TaxID=51655 RepID=A0A8S4G5D8_PLUXY|nr:unnamed protein product [Plutella xylostella]